MNIELENRLESAFPFYKTCSIEVGDGWFGLLWAMSEELSKIVPKEFCVVQVKEKFAILRYYALHDTEETYEIMDKYEKLSATICENCGSKGRLQKKYGWLKTICDKCYKEW